MVQPVPQGSPRFDWRAVAWSAVLVGAVAAAYRNSLGGGPVLDDHTEIIGNASIRKLWPLDAVFSPPTEAGTAGRPLANLSLALNYAWSGLDLWSYHLLNLVLHASSGIVLFAVARRTLSLATIPAALSRVAAPLAAAIALLWALHPVQTAAVDYVAQRTEVLMSLFFLVTLWAALEAALTPSRTWTAAAVLACAAGMACKETMVTAPLAVLLYDRTFLAGSLREAWQRRPRFYVALGATWLLLALLMWRSGVASRGVGFGQGISWLDYATAECVALLRYVQLALCPYPLVFDYGWAYGHAGLTISANALGCLALLGATGVTLVRWPRVGFCLAWFLLLLAPTSSVVPIVQQPIAESRMYLPLAGIVALVVVGIFAALRAWAFALIAIVAIAFGGLTLLRNQAFVSEIALYTDTITKQPNNARAHGILAEALLQAKRTPEAMTEAQRAIALRPNYAEAHNTLGAALAATGQNEDAIAHYRLALAAKPELAEAHYNLGCALAALGHPAEALAAFETALRLKPARADTHNNLGVVLLQLGRGAEAIAHDEAAVKLAPDFASAHYNLGNALAAAGRLNEAAAAYETALKLDPNFAAAQRNLARVRSAPPR